MTELVYSLCAWVMLPWIINTTWYDFYVDGQHTTTLIEGSPSVEGGYKTQVCRPYYYTDIVYQYKARNVNGVSDFSPPLTVQWVWNFDYDDDGIVGFGDFGQFSNDFGTTVQRSDANENGIVGFGDFGKFVQRFGECHTSKVVPCG